MDEQTRTALIPVIERLERLIDFATSHPAQMEAYRSVFGDVVIHELKAMTAEVSKGIYNPEWLMQTVKGLETRIYPMTTYKWN